MTSKPRKNKGFLHRHSLSIVVGLCLAALLVLYSLSDAKTRMGTLFGNAIADWSGLLVVVLATKHLYETGSAESRNPPHPLLRPFPELIREHSLTIFLLATGVGWVLLFLHMDAGGRWGEVVGNIISEWTQIIAAVWLTKKLMEVHSKESKK